MIIVAGVISVLKKMLATWLMGTDDASPAALVQALQLGGLDWQRK